MHPHIKQLWIQALESGDYLKGYEQLRSKEHWCCTGVLSDLYNQHNTDGKWVIDDKDHYWHCIRTAKTRCDVLPAVLIWAGFIDSELIMLEDVVIQPKVRDMDLAAYNDLKHSWPPIIKVIKDLY